LLALASEMFLVLSQFRRWAQSLSLLTKLDGDLSLQQLTALYLIRIEELTPGLLARRLLITPTVVTGIVDRLERRGYVRRENDPRDRRRQTLVVTDEGRRISLAAERALATHLAAQLADLTSAQLGDVRRGLTYMERVLCRLEMADAGMTTGEASVPGGDGE
jgi:DNA-binding MarR family transcriptional regulator